MTEAGEKVLRYMLENEKIYSNVFCAKVIGEGLFIHARSVTGAMRKLITDGYVEQVGQNPVSYSLTDTARSWQN
jgi:Mn-dependent DtxR family transcriptional regulator